MKGLLKAIRNIIGDQLLAVILQQILTEEKIIGAVDSFLDILEDLAEKTKIKADDRALRKIRKVLNIPDND